MRSGRVPVILLVCGVLACGYSWLRSDANAAVVAAGAPPAISYFYPGPGQISAGGSSTLSWATVNATSAAIDNGVGTVALSGGTVVHPAATTTYTLTASSVDGTATATVTVKVLAAPVPLVVVSFKATPSTIALGQPTTLSWETQGATSVTIDGGVGVQPPSGSVTVYPTVTTIYTLVASGTTGSVSFQTGVTVETSPIVNLTALPDALIERAGAGGATTSYALSQRARRSRPVQFVPLQA